MNQKYIDTLTALTAPDQIFAFKEPDKKNDEIFHEFINIPNTLKEYF